MDIYSLSRAFWDYSFEHPDEIKPAHSALYFFIIEHCNRLGWKRKFGLPTSMAKEAIGIRSYNKYKETLFALVDFGFIELIEQSKNQYSSNIIALSKNFKATNKALDKAMMKHTTKQSESTGSIDIQSYKFTVDIAENILNAFDGLSESEIESILKSVKSRDKNNPTEILEAMFLSTKQMDVLDCAKQYFIHPRYQRAKEILQMHNGVTEIGLKHIAVKFNDHRHLEGKGTTTVEEWAKHFRFWVQDPKRKAAENEQKEVKGNGLSAELNKEIFGI